MLYQLSYTPPVTLLNNSCDNAGADRAATFADSEAQLLFHSDRHNQFDFHLNIITRHHHFRARWQAHNARHISGTEIKLRTVIGKERRMTTTLFLRQNISLSLKLSVRGNRPRPGSITPHTKFKAEAYILTKEEGGRHTPFFTNYRPQFYFRTTDVTGVVSLPSGTEMVMPGDNVEMEVELIVPVAMEEKLRFAIREGGRTVGAGVVAAIIE